MDNELLSFARLIRAAAKDPVEVELSCSREARNFRRKLYRLRDIYRGAPEIDPPGALLADKLEFKVVGRRVVVSIPSDPLEGALSGASIPSGD